VRERPTWATTLAANEASLSSVRDRVLAGADLQTGQTVLDLGAGTGLLTFGALARVAPHGRVISLDRDPGCLDAISRRAAARGLYRDRIQVVAGLADALPLADAAVDAVVVRSVLVYVGDRAAAAGEIRRVLRPGGRVSAFEPLPGRLHESGGVDWRPVWAVRLALERLVEEQRRSPRDRAVAEASAEELASAFRSAGLADVEVQLDETAKSPPADPAAHFDLLRLPGDPSPDDPPWHARLRALFAEADLRAYVEHAVREARRGRYRVVLPSLYLRARRN
jgi:SAM-dependent methyltransferase